MDEGRITESVAAGGPPTARPGRVELLALGTELAQRFEITEVLGTGGFAHVYRARDRSLGREVALKVLRPDRLSPTARKRLRREAAVARDVVHPHLVRIFDLEEAGEAVFLTMEVVDGGTVAERVSDGPLPVDLAVRWTSQALAGLAALHALGILHRDVKPGNLLVDGRGDVKVSDFGLALHLERDETRATTHESVLGTLEYLSPEQALGRPVDARSDLYSLGVVVYEMVAGRLPFDAGSSLGSLLERLREERLPDLHEVRPDCPAWLADFAARLLARRPEDRFASAHDALAALDARRAGLRPSTRRRRAAAVAFVALAALAAASLVVRAHSRSRFASVVDASVSTVRAVDRAGRTLWERPGHIFKNFVRLDTRRLGPVIAAMLDLPTTTLGEPGARLSFLDPQTGAVIETLQLRTGALSFPDFSDSYGARLRTLDLDGDGSDELLLTLAHYPYYPSFQVLVEPDRQASRVVFAANGHHEVLAVADLDGDGRKDLLFGGTANRIGFQTALAAVRLGSPIGASEARTEMGLYPKSPDLTVTGEDQRNLLWYALAPTVSIFTPEARLEVDAARRELRLVLGTGESATFDFAGFLQRPDAPPALERSRHRDSSWKALRSANRLLAMEQPGEAAPLCAEAVAEAHAAADPVLEEWANRVAARARLRAGDEAGAIASWNNLCEGSRQAPEIAYEAALALHAAGRLQSAVAFYRRALGRGADVGFGRNRYEVARARAFALLELGRGPEAVRSLEDYAASVPAQPMLAERAFVAWRANGVLPATDPLETGAWTDIETYWWLELRAARGEPTADLLARIAALRPLLSGFQPLVDGLEAELRRRADPRADVAPSLRRAILEARRLARDEPLYRAHLPMLVERLRRLGGAPAA